MAGEAAICCLTHIQICIAGSLKRRLVWNEVSQILIVHTQDTCVSVHHISTKTHFNPPLLDGQ